MTSTQITLIPASAITTSGTGTAVALNASFGCARVSSLVSNLSVGGSVKVYLEASVDGSKWREVYASEALASAQEVETVVEISPLTTHLRARYEVTGSATLEIGAIALTSYAALADLYRFGSPAATLSSISVEDRIEALAMASELSDGFLRGKYKLPLVNWGSDLARAVALIAQADLILARGLQPESESYALITHQRENAMTWLSDVAKGRVILGVIDSSPVESQPSKARAHVVTSALRGW